MKNANESISKHQEKTRVSEESIKELESSQVKQKTKIKNLEKKLNETKNIVKQYE